MNRVALVLSGLAIATLPSRFGPSVAAAQGFDFYARGPYRPAVPRPDSLLGYRVGTQQTMYYQQQQVLDRMIAAAPDRVRTEVIGTTAEGKVMRLLIISSPENIARLEQIRGDVARLGDPRTTTPEQAKAIAQATPAIALLSHSVHGNEPAGFEAVMQTAYQLLASDEPATLEILRNVVVLLNPSQNPDGHERFAAWSNSIAVGSDDPWAIEQTEPWSIWGRYNHYRFDMNRDMLAQTQLEARALAGAMARWRPQVVADLHSTTSQYFFPPVAQAINRNLPASSTRWFEKFGKANGAAFDSFGWQYYVRDVFDFFYPGYVDAWPTFRGAIGMTFESDGGPELKKRKNDGSYMTFEMGIAHHYVASLTTLSTLAASRAERLQDYYEFHATGMAEARTRALKRVIIGPGADPAQSAWMARLLARENVTVTRTTQPLTVLKATSYLGGPPARETFPAGSYVIDLEQPEARFATAVLEPRAVFDSAFVAAQLARYKRNQVRGEEADREGYEFYDITAWTLPLTLNLDAWWTDDQSPVTGTAVGPADTVPTPPAPGRAGSAYVFSDNTEAGARLAMYLLNDGFRLSVATRPMMADGRSYPRGTFVARIQRNPATLHERIVALAARTGAEVTAVASAFPDSGQVGVGSESVVGLYPPRVLLLGGEGVEQTSFGSIWWYFERQLEYPIVPVLPSSLARMDLDRYNVLIIPSASPRAVLRDLGDAGTERLKSWVRGGGLIIAMGEAVPLLSRKELELSTVKVIGEDGDTTGKGTAKDTTITPAAQPAPPLVSPSAPGGGKPEWVPGSIFRSTLDQTHWLTFGYPRNHLPVLVSSQMLKPSKKGDNPVVFVGDSLTLAGFTWPDNTEKFLKGSVWAAVENVGRGRVVVFADDPLFRGFWRGPARLVTNAVLFGTGR